MSKLLALYNGKEYSAGLRSDGSIILRSDNMDDISFGFKVHNGPNKNVKALKYVDREELDGLYEEDIIAKYNGYDFWVIEEKEDQICIESSYDMDYRKSLELGLEFADKGIYRKWINKDEAQIRVEKKPL